CCGRTGALGCDCAPGALAHLVDECREHGSSAADVGAYGLLGRCGVTGADDLEEHAMRLVGGARLLDVMVVDAQIGLDRDVQRLDLPHQLAAAAQAAQMAMEVVVTRYPVVVPCPVTLLHERE